MALLGTYICTYISLCTLHTYILVLHLCRCYRVGIGKQCNCKFWRGHGNVFQDGDLLQRTCWPIICIISIYIQFLLVSKYSWYLSIYYHNTTHTLYDTGRREYLTEAVIFWNKQNLLSILHYLYVYIRMPSNNICTCTFYL